MPWFRADDNLPRSKKVLSIPRRYRAQAMGLWVLAGTWSAGELTDGFIPEYMLDELGGSPAMAARLVTARLWERSELGWNFVHWSTYQRVRSEVEHDREEARERKRKSRERAMKQRKTSPDQQEQESVTQMSQRDTSVTGPSVTAESHPGHKPPIPTQPNPSLISGRVFEEGGLTYRASQPPSTKCAAHEHTPNPPRCGPCADARRTHDAWERANAEQAAEHAAEARERAEAARADAAFARQTEIDACHLCDDRGYAGHTVCNHDPATTERAARGIAAARAAITRKDTPA